MKPKTATASFRLDESALQILQEDTKKQNVSVNTLLDPARSHIRQLRPTDEEVPMIKLPASSFKHILEGANRPGDNRGRNFSGRRRPKTYIVAR